MAEKKPIDFFNYKQQEIIRYYAKHSPDILILDGAVRSSKSVLASTLFIRHCKHNANRNLDFILTGHSISAIKRNILKPIYQDLFGIDTKLNENNAFRLFGNTVHCFGGTDADSHEAMQGMTAAGHYGNELTLCHPNTIAEVLARCSIQGAKFFWEMNPAGPTHQIYREYIEPTIHRGNTKEVARFGFTIDDNSQANNGYLDDVYIARLKANYSGVWYKKYILGEWTALEGQIYHVENLQYYDEKILQDREFFKDGSIIGYIDPAAGSTAKTGCFTSFIIGMEKNSKIYILDAFVRKSGVEETKQLVAEMLSKYKFAALYIEDNFTQAEYVVKPLKNSFPYAPIYGYTNREEKLSRLIGMQGVVYQKVVFPSSFVSDRNSEGWILIQQLTNVSKNATIGQKDTELFVDGPDALEGLIRNISKAQTGAAYKAIVGGGRELKEGW